MGQHRAYIRYRFKINVPNFVFITCISSGLPNCATFKKVQRPFLYEPDCTSLKSFTLLLYMKANESISYSTLLLKGGKNEADAEKVEGPRAWIEILRGLETILFRIQVRRFPLPCITNRTLAVSREMDSGIRTGLVAVCGAVERHPRNAIA